jgi:uncharacterized protein Yka (UPF0111/DUF47 family)
VIRDPKELKKRIKELRSIIESEVGNDVKIVELRKKIDELEDEIDGR